VRAVVGEDEALFREGLVRLLREAGFDVVAQAADAPDLIRKATAHRPDLVLTDVRMPPGEGDDGLRAAVEIRRRQPAVRILVLSQYVAQQSALELLGEGADGVGYLLKQRVYDLDEFTDAVRRVARGGSALDPDVVAQLLGRRHASPLDGLTSREREVLALVAQGRSNQAIAERLVIGEHAVEKHVASILRKLDIPVSPADHRRVLAVLAFLRAQ
jgi:DNA-binding NarL/FixJ family response regulator